MSERPTHLDGEGRARMVDVSDKSVTVRTAVASGRVEFPSEVFDRLSSDNFLVAKGGIFQTASIAATMAVKKTSDLIPLCHPLPVTKIGVDLAPDDGGIAIRCTVKCSGKTGVEMEALTGVSVAALTVYDMCKALSHDIRISDIKLESKTGGKRDFER